jgi:hypothetical protein
MSVARTIFNITVNEKFSNYGYENLTVHLYLWPISIASDYTITGTRATDSNGDPIVGVDKGDGQYGFSDVEYNIYTVVAYKTGIIPQVVNGYDKFEVIPKLASDEIDCSQADDMLLKDKINSIIAYLDANSTTLSLGTPATLII